MRSLLKASVFVFAAFICAGTALAHEFFVMPRADKEYKSGQELPVSVFSTHVFVKGEELEAKGKTRVAYKGADVALTANEQRLTYEGAVTLQGPGAAIIEGHRLPIIWSETPTGEGEGGRSVFKDAVHSSRYEKFVKVILPVDGKTDGFNRVVGHRLEIVPVDDILAAKPGDEVLFKVLLDGKPARFDEVRATYDGFTDIPSAWAFAAAPVSHGQAKVRISAPGMWCVQVAVQVAETTDDYDDASLKAMLIFPVK